MRKILRIIILAVCFNSFILPVQEINSQEEDKVWYKVEISQSANPIYVDYKSLKKKENVVRYEQLEFLRAKQIIGSDDTQYQFVISKRETDCNTKKYFVSEQKYFDSDVNHETGKVTEKMVYKEKHEKEDFKNWKDIEAGTPLEKVYKFVCLYKDK